MERTHDIECVAERVSDDVFFAMVVGTKGFVKVTVCSERACVSDGVRVAPSVEDTVPVNITDEEVERKRDAVAMLVTDEVRVGEDTFEGVSV